MEQSVSKGVRPAWIYAIALGGSAFLLGATLAGGQPLEARLAALTAGTARFAFAFFALAFTASAWGVLVPARGSRWLLLRRRHIGLSFAVVHFIHLGALVALHVERGVAPGVVTVVGGGTAYVFLLAMVLTSNRWARQRMGRDWRRLHLTGSWYLWAIFAQSYVGRVIGGAEPYVVYVLLTGVIVAIPVLRGLAWWARRRQHAGGGFASDRLSGLS